MGIQAHSSGGKSGFRLIHLKSALTWSKRQAHGITVPCGAILRPKSAARRERPDIAWAALQMRNERVAFQPTLQPLRQYLQPHTRTPSPIPKRSVSLAQNKEESTGRRYSLPVPFP